MNESILISVKKLIGLSEDDTSFDTDLLFHINTVCMVLSQLGITISSDASLVEEDSTWEELLGSDCDPEAFRAIRSYIALKVRKIFDPPQNGTVMQSIDSIINELEWRLNVQVDPIDD